MLTFGFHQTAVPMADAFRHRTCLLDGINLTTDPTACRWQTLSVTRKCPYRAARNPGHRRGLRKTMLSTARAGVALGRRVETPGIAVTTNKTASCRDPIGQSSCCAATRDSPRQAIHEHHRPRREPGSRPRRRPRTLARAVAAGNDLLWQALLLPAIAHSRSATDLHGTTAAEYDAGMQLVRTRVAVVIEEARAVRRLVPTHRPAPISRV